MAVTEQGTKVTVVAKVKEQKERRNELCPAVLLNWQVCSPFSTYPKNHWCDFFSVVSAGFTWTLEYSMHLKINGVRLLSV